MKKFFLLTALVAVVGLFQVNAQTCPYAKAKMAETSKYSCSKSAAAKLAALDKNIEERVDPLTGKTSYVRKKVCAASGHVSFVNVEYSEKNNAFNTAEEAIQVSSQAKKYNCTAAQKAKCMKSCSPAQRAACAKANEKAAAVKNKSA